MVPLPQMVLSWPRIIVILVGGTNTYTTESATKQEIQLRMKRIHSTTEATRFCKILARIISVRAGLPGACENIPNKLGFKMAGQKNLRKMKPTTISSDTIYKYVQLTAVYLTFGSFGNCLDEQDERCSKISFKYLSASEHGNARSSIVCRLENEGRNSYSGQHSAEDDIWLHKFWKVSRIRATFLGISSVLPSNFEGSTYAD